MIKRFTKYYRPYIGIILLDLFCASLSIVCELIFPLIVRYITNVALKNEQLLLMSTVLRLGGAYLFLRIGGRGSRHGRAA